MAFGIQTPHMTITDRLTRIVGTLTLPAGAGSMTIPEWAGQAGWFYARISNINVGGTEGTITISGSTLSWDAPAGGKVLTYGVY